MDGTGTLRLVNAANARDLGGHQTVDGRRVRRGLLYRANALNRLTDADVDALGALDLACLVDFRHPDEIEVTGPDRLPQVPPGRVVSLPLFDPEHDVFTLVSNALRGLAGADALLRLHPDHDSGGGHGAMLGLYRWFITAPMARQVFAEAMDLIASAETLPMLFHCTAGKDRTGWLSALVLTALEVPRPQVVADYLLTNELNKAGTEHVLASVADRLDDPMVLLPMLQARAEYLDAAFQAADEHYGGMSGYLRDGLGVDGATLARLRAALLE